VPDDNKYDKARDLSERALDAVVHGDEDEATKLIDQAKATNPRAVEDIVQELEEDATSEHNLDKISEDLGRK
jgi:hypothetical protein